MAGTTPCWTVERTGLCPCGSGRLVVTQSPGSARPDLCLTPVELAAWKPVSCQALGAGKGDWLQMQLHSRKQSPGGVWGCDTTTANLSCFLRGSDPQWRKSCSCLLGCSPFHGSRVGTGMLWGGCQDLPGASGTQALPHSHCCSL